ncbi:uncharacterized protein LOC114873258 [Osmia bicornis bicornis]|uniref:uncharacterized protein LOC114873258 n=1 Tax=Osmia bicornis bicornis TaxID=1437191 RepID=UPI0010F6803E|nr:uncharacterized protein LOC114873258 [Osmia bicornis bicornis]
MHGIQCSCGTNTHSRQVHARKTQTEGVTELEKKQTKINRNSFGSVFESEDYVYANRNGQLLVIKSKTTWLFRTCDRCERPRSSVRHDPPYYHVRFYVNFSHVNRQFLRSADVQGSR